MRPWMLGKAANLRSTPPREGEHFRTRIKDSWDGIRFELGRMVETVRHAIGDEMVIDLAGILMSNAENPRDMKSVLAFQYDWIRGVVSYTPDPYSLEKIQTPNRMIRQSRMPPQMLGAILAPVMAVRQGRDLAEVEPHEIVPVPAKILADCDEQAMLCATLPAAIGMRTRFRLGGTEGIEGYHHVWAQADPYGTGEWLDMDPTEPEFDTPGKYPLMDKYATLEIFP